MADTADTVDKLQGSVQNLSKSLTELQSGFSSVSKAIPTSEFLKLSTTNLELSRQLTLSNDSFIKLQESIQKLGRETRNYSQTELTSLIKQLQTTDSTFGRLTSTSDKYVELLATKFPTGAEGAIRALQTLSRQIPELSLALEQGAKTQFDYATATSILARGGPELLGLYTQLTAKSTEQDAAVQKDIEAIRAFHTELTKAGIALQKDLIPVLSGFTQVLQFSNDKTDGFITKLAAMAIGLAAVGKAFAFVKGGLAEFGILAGARTAGGAVASGAGAGVAAGAATGTFGANLAGAGGFALSRLLPPVAIGLLLKEGLELGARQYYKEEADMRDMRRSPAERASIARGIEIGRMGGNTEYAATDETRGILARGEYAAGEKSSQASRAGGVNRELLQREGLLKRLSAQQEAMNLLETYGLQNTKKYSEIQLTQIRDTSALMQIGNRVTENYRSQRDIIQTHVDVASKLGVPFAKLLKAREQERDLDRQIISLRQKEVEEMTQGGKKELETNETLAKRREIIQMQAEITMGAFQDRMHAYDDERKILDANESIQESRIETLKAMNRPLSEITGGYIANIKNIKSTLDLEKQRLEVMKKTGDQALIRPQEAVVASLQARLANQAVMARRTWMEQMTGAAIGLSEGTYTVPNELPGLSTLGPGYQSFRNMMPGERFGGTMEMMRTGLENEAWSGGAWRSPIEQDTASAIREGNNLAQKQLDVLQNIERATKGSNGKDAPNKTNMPDNSFNTENGFFGSTDQNP